MDQDQSIQPFLSIFSNGQEESETRGTSQGNEPRALHSKKRKKKKEKKKSLSFLGPFIKRQENVIFAASSILQLTVCSFSLLFSFYKEIKSLNIGKMKNSFPYNLIWFVCFLVLAFCFVLLV